MVKYKLRLRPEIGKAIDGPKWELRPETAIQFCVVGMPEGEVARIRQDPDYPNKWAISRNLGEWRAAYETSQEARAGLESEVNRG